MPKTDVARIRWVQTSTDMPAIMEIEGENPDPWTQEEFEEQLRQRNCVGEVCEIRGQIAGFLVYEFKKSVNTIANIAVRKDCRRALVGSFLVDKLIRTMYNSKRDSIELAIRESNLPGLYFFKSLGFQATGIYREMYDNGDDGIAMEYLRGQKTGV
jgi:ribosomal protein S18 acetylase RimI-like enzyme